MRGEYDEAGAAGTGEAVIGARVVALAVVLAGLITVESPSAGAGGAPAPTPERTGAPANIASIGDSISTATGTGNLGAETPENAWVVGTNGSVNSMRARLGIPSNKAYLQASNGRRIQHFDDQAASLPLDTQYVVVELGGNDLCRPSVGEMTSEAAYRSEVQAGLAAVKARTPEALIFLASVPDVYNLWYLRGAPSSVNPHVADQTGQEGQARLYWDNPLIDVIPCQSLLNNPTSTSATDENRRQQVRARNLAFNQILEQECAAVLRCRFDAHALFNFSSNRVTPPHGALLPRTQWGFEDIDISHNFGFWDFLCPAPGILEGGTVCGDHFHPSLQGQAKLAEGAHVASYDFTDTQPPTATATPSRPADAPAGWAAPVTVTFGATDDVGVRGQEVRIHPPGGGPGPWVEHLGLAPSVEVTATGTTSVEVRSLDVNGNQSASTILAITVDPSLMGSLDGTVTAGGQPAADVTVLVDDTPGPGGTVVGGTTTGGDGTYDIGPAQPGDYDVAFTPDDPCYQAALETITIDPSEAEHLDVDLPRAPPGPHGLSDVPPWLEEAVRWLVDACRDPQYMTGYPDGTFRDPLDITRGQAVRALYRIAGSPDVTGLEHGFSDVPGWLDDAVRWAGANDFMTGYPDGTFRPNRSITRAQAHRVQYRVAGSPAPPGDHGFSDVPPWVETAVDWMATAADPAYVTGFPDGTYRPDLPITRGQFGRTAYRINT